MSIDFGASISEEPSSPVLYENIRQDQFGRTVIELNHPQDASNPPSPSNSPPVLNGNSNEIDKETSHSVYSENNNDHKFNPKRSEPTELTRKEDKFQGNSVKKVEKTSLDHGDTVSCTVVKAKMKEKRKKNTNWFLKLCKLNVAESSTF